MTSQWRHHDVTTQGHICPSSPLTRDRQLCPSSPVRVNALFSNCTLPMSIENGCYKNASLPLPLPLSYLPLSYLPLSYLPLSYIYHRNLLHDIHKIICHGAYVELSGVHEPKQHVNITWKYDGQIHIVDFYWKAQENNEVVVRESVL